MPTVTHEIKPTEHEGDSKALTGDVLDANGHVIAKAGGGAPLGPNRNKNDKELMKKVLKVTTPISVGITALEVATEVIEGAIQGGVSNLIDGLSHITDDVGGNLEGSGSNIGDGLSGQIRFDSKQVGKKFGKHKSDYPYMKDHTDYIELAEDIFNSPNQIIYNSEEGEYYYTRGDDLLIIKKDGTFVGMYPGAKRFKVIKAIWNGGVIWP